MLTGLLALALAAEPVVTKGKDSWIEGYVDVAVSPEAAFAVVSDPAAVSRIDGSTQTTVERDGECHKVSVHVDHPIASVDYQVRSCPDGELAVADTLLGGDMKEFATRWWVVPQGEGARIHYKVRTVAAIPVPQWLVDRSTYKGAQRVLTRLRDHLEAS